MKQRRGRPGIDGQRLNITLGHDQVTVLTELAVRRRISVSSLIREAIDSVFLRDEGTNMRRIDADLAARMVE